MYRWQFVMVALVFSSVFLPGVVAQAEVPIASTVPLSEVASVGTVITYDEATDTFAPSTNARDDSVYGVVNERPTLVFRTATTSVPVVTNGVSEVRVSEENGAISRGDVLTTAEGDGVAQRADRGDTAVFAVALQSSAGEERIAADISVERAKARQAELRAAEREDEVGDGLVVSTARAVVAALVVLSGLGFLLYSYRSVLAGGVVSVGRNPRAKRTVMLVGVGSMLLAVVVSLVVIFIAVGILVLPV